MNQYCKKLGLFVANRELKEEFGLTLKEGLVQFIEPNQNDVLERYQIISDIDYVIEDFILKIRIRLEGNSVSRLKSEIIRTNNSRGKEFEVTSLYG